MRIHALEATGGLTYAEMGRFMAKPGTPAKFTDGNGGTSVEQYALVDPKTKQPVDNGARNLWVTETALTTALNASYMADRLSLFGVVVGIALLLSGIGFGILAIGGALRNPETALTFRRKPEPVPGEPPHTHRRTPPSQTTGRRKAARRPFSGRFEQAFGEGVAHQLGAAGEPQLLHDVGTVRLGGPDRDVQLLRDLLVRVPERQQA